MRLRLGKPQRKQKVKPSLPTGHQGKDTIVEPNVPSKAVSLRGNIVTLHMYAWSARSNESINRRVRWKKRLRRSVPHDEGPATAFYTAAAPRCSGTDTPARCHALMPSHDMNKSEQKIQP
eukprot:scaffold575_cov186-Amphora_coffeaeformis.AAC.8